MEQILIIELIKKAQSVITTFGYKPSTIRHYNDHWNELRYFFESNNHPLFSMELSDKFLALQKDRESKGLMSASNMRGIRRAVYILQQCYSQDGNIKWERIQRHIVKLDDAPMLLAVYEQYRYNISSSLSKGSVEAYCRIVESFLDYLKKRMIHCIVDTTQEDIKDFIGHISQSHPNGLHVVLPVLRSFLRFMIEQDSIMQPLLWAVPQNVGRHFPLISTLTGQELQELDSFIRQDHPSPKRNYAIFLLASRMGLRKSDIAGLKLCNIDWQHSIIKIIQQKTSQELAIPLIVDVGNALADYILNERQDIPNQYVFLRFLAPYEGISPAACSEIIRLAMKHCCIHEEKGMSQGIHCLRHTIAHKMLAESVPLPVISSILGHKDKNSTKIYLSVDTKTLRFCALDLSGIEVEKEELL